MDQKRPVGITILGIYLLLCVIPSFFAAIIGGISGAYIIKSTLDVVLDIVMRILFITSPLICITTGVGLLRLKNWARLITMFLSPVLSFIVIGISGIFLDTIIPPNIVSLTIVLGTVIISIGIIYYLTRSKVKEQFKKEKIPNA